MITNVILILYNSSINNKLQLRDSILPVFAAFRRQKIIPNSYSEVLNLSDSFMNESFVKMIRFIKMIWFSRNNSLINSDVLPPAGGLFSF